MNNKIKRIALIGPESTGKTTLCQQLAHHFKTVWVPEYAREYVEKLNQPYTLQDIELCTRKQIELEDELIQNASHFIFSDTELIVAKIWCEDVFKTCPEWIEQEIENRKYNLYLLTSPDLSFQEDPVRENPHRRDYFFDLYKKELNKRSLDFEIIAGKGNLRLEQAIKTIHGRFVLSNDKDGSG